MESGNHDDYIVKVDGSGRLSKRTRAHLRPIQVYDDVRPQRMPELPLPGPPAADDHRPQTPPQPGSPLPMTPATPTASSTPRTGLGPPIPFPDLPPPQPVEAPEAAPEERPPVTPPPSAEPTGQPTPPAPRRSERARRAPERLIMNCTVEGGTP